MRTETTATIRILRSVSGFPSRVVRVVAHGAALSAAQTERAVREAVLQQAAAQLKNALLVLRLGLAMGGTTWQR